MTNITPDQGVTPTAETQPSKTETNAKKATKSAKPAKKAANKEKPAKKGKPAKKPAKPTAESASERSNKKAEVIAMMRRSKGATLDEIMQATAWQKHTVRGFVSILGSKGGHSIESSKSADGERTYKITR